MDARLSQEQQALRDAAARLVDRLAPRTVEALDDIERAEKLDAAIAAAGWRELRSASDTDGPWASAVEAAIVADELARGLADTAFVGPTLAADLRRLADAPAARQAETVALDATLERPAVAGEGARADWLGIDARGCHAALVVRGESGGHSIGQVAVSSAQTTVDLTRPTAPLPSSVSVEPVPGATRVITDNDFTRWCALGLALSCADLVGVMRGAAELATEYAIVRRQYGVAIGSFQAVQHLLADALVATEGSRSVALHAAWSVDALPPNDAFAACAAAKAYCSRAALAVCETAIQVHGGIGNTWECLAHVYLRRALVSIDTFGGVGTNLDRVLAHRGIGVQSGLC
ncbi:MAG: acyl-CoA dehydrogenase family protein [Actinomycetota bacterium]|nr:acyl-CoA dehydrogenase family protein [Actinomycetota bacterium]